MEEWASAWVRWSWAIPSTVQGASEMGIRRVGGGIGQPKRVFRALILILFSWINLIVWKYNIMRYIQLFLFYPFVVFAIWVNNVGFFSLISSWILLNLSSDCSTFFLSCPYLKLIFSSTFYSFSGEKSIVIISMFLYCELWLRVNLAFPSEPTNKFAVNLWSKEEYLPLEFS